MPRVEWSFFLPAEDHKQVKRFLFYCHSRFTVWGIIFVVAAVIGSAISSVGTQISAYLFPSFILAVLIIAYTLSFLFIPKIEARRILPPKINAGGFCPYKVILKNLGKRPIRNLAVFERTLPYGLYAAITHPAFQNTVDWLEPGQQATVTLVLRTPKRGTFEILPLVAGSGFPSGLLRSRARAGSRMKIVVYPKYTRQDALQLNLHRQFQPGGISLSSRVGDSNEFSSTRDYRQEDRLRDIHWASSARTGKLIVKEYIEEYFIRVGLFLDTELKRFEKHKCLEARISLCAGIAEKLNADNYIVDLLLSDEHLQHLQIGRSLDTFDHLLELLSAVEGEIHIHLERAAARIEELSRDLSLVILLLKDWDPPRSRFVEQLNESGVKTRVIIVRDRPTTLPCEEENITIYKTTELDSVK